MNGDIKNLLRSNAIPDKTIVYAAFGDDFQTWESWQARLHHGLYGGRVSSQLTAPLNCWSVSSFHALFIACWIHHPVEKGTFVISLHDLSMNQRDTVKAAVKKHLSTRKSSHLSGKGYSASRGWDFLKGYDELLVQIENDNNHQPFLMLKAEGHTTGITGVIPHIKSWNHKRKTGAGLQASAVLNAMPTMLPGMVVGRAAENYDKHYEKLLKVLGFHGKMTTVRQMFTALCQQTGWHSGLNGGAATNANIGAAIIRYCDDASTVGAGGLRYRKAGEITGEMITALRGIAATMQRDNSDATDRERVFQEVRVNAATVDGSLIHFRTV